MPINITGSWNLTGSFQATSLLGAMPASPAVGLSNLLFFSPTAPSQSTLTQQIFLTGSVTSSMSVSASGIHLVSADATGTGSLNITMYPDLLNNGDVAIIPLYIPSGSVGASIRFRTIVSSSNGIEYYHVGSSIGTGAIGSGTTRSATVNYINYNNSLVNPTVMVKNLNGTVFMGALGSAPFPGATMTSFIGNQGTPL